MKDMWILIEEFLEYYESLNMSEKTAKNYAVDLKQFDKWVNTQNFTELSEISIKDIESFIKSLGEIKPATAQRKISSLRMFFSYLKREKIITSNVAKDVKPPKNAKTKPDIITKEQASSIIQAVSNENDIHNTNRSLRNLLIIKLFLSLGLRREELANISTSDIDLQQSRILIKGKGNKERYVFLTDEIRKELVKFLILSNLQNKKNELVFALHVASFNNIVNHAMELAGCKKVGRSCHTARKRFASSAYSATHDIYAVANALGHSNLQTIKLYAEVDEEQTKTAFASISY